MWTSPGLGLLLRRSRRLPRRSTVAKDQLQVTKRTSWGSAESRRMRRTGIVPAIVYGRET
ncbi:MAG: hypothetical protein V3V82_04060, partial [Acidimicrobiia bacterium]